MSVLIKGMKLPENRNETIIRIQPNGTILDQYGHHLIIKAVPVPPHVRLIDADAYEALIRGLGNREYRRENGTICDAIKFLHPYYTPTIIPEEEGKT